VGPSAYRKGGHRLPDRDTPFRVGCNAVLEPVWRQMRRRQFITLLGGTAVAWPLAARAQQRAVPVIGFVSIATREASLQASWYQAFHDGIRDLGWEPGRNLLIEYSFADNKPDRLAALVQDLIRLNPDVIFVPTRPALPAVKEATTTIPIVFVSLGDPVAEGWVASFARPGGNLTGVAGSSPDIAGKRLELLRELVPSLLKVAVLWNPANSPEVVAVKATEIAARSLGISLIVEHIAAPGDFDRAIVAIAQSGAKSVVVLPDPLFLANRERLVELIRQSRLAAIYMETGFVAAGGLISYGPNFTELFRRASVYVDRILKGTKPADLPVEQPTKFELVVNLKAANAIGVTVPTSILLRATEVIE
jgi:putative ABC transport system substrate-binding protein